MAVEPDLLVSLSVSGVTTRASVPLLMMADSSGKFLRGMRLYLDAPFELDPDLGDEIGYGEAGMAELSRLHTLLGRTVTDASASTGGVLSVDFDNEICLTVAAWRVDEG